MGITSILMAAIRKVSWNQVANLAMQYGPDLVRQFKERLHAHVTTEHDEEQLREPLIERIRELEIAIIKQGEILTRQYESIEILEENGRTLQARMQIFIAIATLSALLSLALIVTVLVK